MQQLFGSNAENSLRFRTLRIVTQSYRLHLDEFYLDIQNIILEELELYREHYRTAFTVKHVSGDAKTSILKSHLEH